MNTYFVTWRIDLEADNHQEAAQEALNIMRDKQSLATIFIVEEEGSGVEVEVEL